MSHDHTTVHQVCLVLHAALVCGTAHVMQSLFWRCARQTALERQHLSCTYLPVIIILINAEHIPEGIGRAPRTGAELASNDAQRQAAGALSGSFDAQDVNAVQKKLEQQHS